LEKNNNIIQFEKPQDSFNALVTQASTNYLGTRQELPEKMKVGFGTALAVQFEQENTVGNLIANLKNGTLNISKDSNPDYDPTDDIPEDKLHFWKNYVSASSPQDVDKITRKINRELENRQTLQQAGFGKYFITGMIAGIVDPINLIPVGGSAYKAARLGKIGTAALHTATAGFVSSVAQETLLQSQQETRTPEESAINIAGTTILSGIIGGVAASWTKYKFQKISNSLTEDIHTSKTNLQIDPKTQDIIDTSVGAKQYKELERLQLEEAYKKHLDYSLQTGKKALTEEQFINKQQGLTTRGGAGVVIKSLSKTNPLLRIFTSKSTKAKETLQRLATHNMLVGKNTEGIASQQSVETAIKQHNAGLGSAIQSNRKLFREYKKRINKEGGDRTLKTSSKFNEAVSKALRRDDISDIPEVERAAKEYRNKVFEPLKKEAIELELLPEDVKPEGAVSYLTRIYNRKKIIAQEPILRERMTNKLKLDVIPNIKKGFQIKERKFLSQITSKDVEIAELEKSVSKLKKQKKIDENIQKAYDTKLNKLEKEKNKLEDKLGELQLEFRTQFEDVEDIDQYIENVVDEVLYKLKGTERYNVTMPYELRITKRGPLKERTLTFMTDEELEDFLENDIEKIANFYTRIMGTDVELKKEFGSTTLDNEINEVVEDYNKLTKKAKNEKERVKIEKEKKEVLRDLKALRDIMRGNYGIPNNPDSLIVRGARLSRQLQYLSKLGGVTISSIPDIARAITIHGYARIFNKGLRNLAFNLKGIKLNIKEAKLAGNVLETVLNTRLATLSELTDPYASGSIGERFFTNLSNKFSKITGLAQWNDVMKGFTSVLTQQRLITESKNLLAGKIKKNNKTYLAFLGIDKTNVEKIVNQLNKFSEKEGNLIVANTDKWTDSEAIRLYRNAINLDVDRTIITKTVGDVPLLMNTELGKTIGQFKSFTFASTQQALIAGLQQKDIAALQGLITAISLGSFVYYLKQKGAGIEPDMSPAKLAVEGLDRSGMLGILIEINNLSEKMTRGKIGLNALAGGEIMSRYVSRNLTGTLIGPSSGTIQDIATITAAIANGEISESDIRAVRRLTPYQNLFYIRWLFDDMEKNINRKLGN
jgi:hypothetical protein